MRRLRVLLAVIMLVAPLEVLRASTAPASRDARIRPADSRSAALLLEGLQRSRTFARLVSRIEAGDVIVYVQMQQTLRGRLAGLLSWVTAAGNFRYVRVSINPELTVDLAIAILGHELHHTLEVVNEPSIRDAASLEAFYSKHGINVRSRSSWDTEGARDTGDEVRKDLLLTRTVRLVDSWAHFDQAEWDLAYESMRERVR